jgi:hypothetical protein
VIVGAYHKATDAAPQVDPAFLQLVDAVFDDRHLDRPSRTTVKNVVAGK